MKNLINNTTMNNFDSSSICIKHGKRKLSLTVVQECQNFDEGVAYYYCKKTGSYHLTHRKNSVNPKRHTSCSHVHYKQRKRKPIKMKRMYGEFGF